MEGRGGVVFSGKVERRKHHFEVFFVASVVVCLFRRCVILF